MTRPSESFPIMGHVEGLAVHPAPMAQGLSVLNDLGSVLRMVRVLRRVRPALVHSYTPKAGLVTMLAKWLCRVSVCVHILTGLICPSEHGLRQKLLTWVDRLICSSAPHIVHEGLGVKKDLDRFGTMRMPTRGSRALEDAIRQAMQMPVPNRRQMGRYTRVRKRLRFERQHWEQIVKFYQGFLKGDRHCN